MSTIGGKTGGGVSIGSSSSSSMDGIGITGDDGTCSEV